MRQCTRSTTLRGILRVVYARLVRDFGLWIRTTPGSFLKISRTAFSQSPHEAAICFTE